ncbi:nuclear pore complex protein NUP98A-like [Macadamia integrifolia]|uniref:nuclear pore complex protein NUP98A-like n=1 Tax=Macadamia integrifolia TaxID=60698 RepID=UPI001C4FC950|nr:nuclear pore complex protein NUP98A-like [Macadamia integrifolia]
MALGSSTPLNFIITPPPPPPPPPPAGDSSRLGLGVFSTSTAINNSSTSLFSAPSMTGQKPVSEGFGCNPFPLGNPSQTKQETSGAILFGSKPSSGAFIQPATSQRPGLDASSSHAFGFATASAFGSTGTNPFVSSTPASSSCGSFSIALKCATCEGFDWIPHITQTNHPLFGSTQPLGGSIQSMFTSLTLGSLRIGLKCATCGGFDWVPHLTQPLGESSQPKFASFKIPGFGTNRCFPTKGATSNPIFGTPATSTFGSIGTTFGSSSASTSGAMNKHVFESSSTPAFGSSSAPSSSFSTTPAFSSIWM